MSRKKSAIPSGEDFEDDVLPTPGDENQGPPDQPPEESIETSPESAAASEEEPAFTRRARKMVEEMRINSVEGVPIFEGVAELRLPAAIRPEFPTCRHLNIRLSHRQAWALRAVQEGFDSSRAMLANERRVTTAATAILFLLEQIADAIEEGATQPRETT